MSAPVTRRIDGGTYSVEQLLVATIGTWSTAVGVPGGAYFQRRHGKWRGRCTSVRGKTADAAATALAVDAGEQLLP